MKKITALIIALCIMCSVLQFPATASDNENSEAVETLAALGILEGFGGDFMLDKILTRAEFVTMLTKILNVESAGGTLYFEDVSNEHWAAENIAAACAMGLINGVTETTFEPDRPVLFEQAIKILVNTLGYEPMAVSRGGFPSGYLSIAERIGLLNGIEGKAGLIVRRGFASELIFNALDIAIAKDAVFSENIKKKIVEDKNLLSENMDIIKGEGILDANDVTSLDSDKSMAKGFVRIDDKIYAVGKTDASELLGYNVTYYAEKVNDSDVAELIYIRKNDKENEVITIFSDDIVKDETSENELVYIKENNKEDEIAISPYADLIRNGIAVGGYTKTDMIPLNGTVTLIDNNADSEADVILVYDYETIVVGEIKADIFTAYDNENKVAHVELNPNSDKYSFMLYMQNEKVEFKTLKVGQTLSIAKNVNSDGKEKVIVRISAETATGVLEEFTDDEAVIAGKSYKVTNNFINENKHYLGKNIKGYIDIFGKLVRLDEGVEESFEYAYLIAGDDNSKSQLDNKVSLKLLLASGLITVFESAEKVYLDGDRIKETDLLTRLALSKRDGGSNVEQMIRYRLDSDNKIDAIDTLLSDKGGAGDTLKCDVSLNEYRQRSGILGKDKNTVFVANADMKVFHIPANVDYGDESIYQVTDGTYFNQQEFHTLEGFDYTETMGLNAALIQKTARSKMEISAGARAHIVDTIYTVYENDEVRYKMNCWNNGSEIQLQTKDRSIFTKNGKDFYECGDIIRLEKDKDGFVIKVEPMLVGAADDEVAPGTSGFGTNPDTFYANHTIIYGYLTAVDGNNIVMETAPEEKANVKQPFVLIDNASHYVVSGRRKTIQKVDKSYLIDYLYGRKNAKVAASALGVRPHEIIYYDYE